MHTSKLLKSNDFRFLQSAAGQLQQQTIHDFIPAYHEKDRLGIVAPHVEEGLASTGAAILAVCTAFYDCLRQTGDAFFDYPQHFAFMDITADGVNTGVGRRSCQPGQLGSGWGHLDVWPQSQWIGAGGGAPGFLRRLVDFHIDRVFWPAGLIPQKDDTAPKLPGYARRLLQQRLRSVYLYGTDTADFQIECSPAAQKILTQSQANLAEALGLDSPPSSGLAARYRRVEPAAFLETLEDCF